MQQRVLTSGNGTGSLVVSSRRLPDNLDAERFCLGACMSDATAYVKVAAILAANDFSLEKHKRIFLRMGELHERGLLMDRATVADELTKHGQLQSVDGLGYLVSLDDGLPALHDLEQYAGNVLEKSHLRRLAAIGVTVQEAATSGDEESVAIAQHAVESLFELNGKDVSSLQSPGQIVAGYQGGINAYLDTSKRVKGVGTGLLKLDEMTGGLREGELIIVAARPAMGKTAFALNVAQHVAMNLVNPLPVAIFSLEMSKESLLTRLICSTARVDQQRFRAGYLNAEERHALQDALYRLAESPIYIDDSAGTNLMDVHNKCRRLQQEQGLGLVVIDYIQLMQGRGRYENRVQEISSLSRGFKLMSKELRVPFLVLSQLSRAPETRPGDHRPMLSDLRESGCLAGETRVTLSDGSWVPIQELVDREAKVLTMDSWRVAHGEAIRVWKTGHQPVFKLVTSSGRAIRATANHRFFCLSGYVPLGELKPGDRIGVARSFPTYPTESLPDDRLLLLAHMIGDGCCAPRQPLHYTSASEANLQAVSQAAQREFGIASKRVRQRNWSHLYFGVGADKWHPNPMTSWLRNIDLDGKRSYEKFVPACVFGLGFRQIAFFLHHLWATDGSAYVNSSRDNGVVYYSTSSHQLALDVQELLHRCGVLSRIREARKAGYRVNYHVHVYGAGAQRAFASNVGIFGERAPALRDVVALLAERKSNTNVDTIPKEVWGEVLDSMKAEAVTQRQMACLRGTAYGGGAHMRFAPSRTTLAEYASVLASSHLKEIAESDIFWDSVVRIEPDGTEDVYDMSVSGSHNFLANGLVVHNSLEQDADMVAFIFREEVYRPDKESLRGLAEVILAKQRNGPTGRVKCVFLNRYTKFENHAGDTGLDDDFNDDDASDTGQELSKRFVDRWGGAR